MFQTDLLKGKRILITGGGTGLGFSMGRRFLELGAGLVICGRRAEVLKEAAAKLGGDTGGKVETQVCDVRGAELAGHRRGARHRAPRQRLLHHSLRPTLAEGRP